MTEREEDFLKLQDAHLISLAEHRLPPAKSVGLPKRFRLQNWALHIQNHTLLVHRVLWHIQVVLASASRTTSFTES